MEANLSGFELRTPERPVRRHRRRRQSSGGFWLLVIGLTLGAALLLALPEARLAGAVLVAVTLVEAARTRLRRVTDETAARLLRRVVPFAVGLAVAGAAYSFLYVVQVSPRALAGQVGLAAEGLTALFPVTLAAYAGWLLATSLVQLSPRVQRWVTAGRSARLRSACLLLSAVALIAIPFAPVQGALYGLVAAATLCGLGSQILKCEAVGAAQSHGHLDKAAVAALAGYVVAIIAIPAIAGTMAGGDYRLGGVAGYAWVFIGLGVAMAAGARLVPPLLRPGPVAVAAEEGPGLRDRRLWRAIALTTASFAALGPIDAGLVYMIASHTDANAELWAGLALLSTLPLTLVITKLEPLMKRRVRTVAVVGAGLGLGAALIGLAVAPWSGVPWGIVFGTAFGLFEPSTTLLFLVAEWIALRDPANWERSALVTGIRLGGRAIAAFAFTIGGEILGWQVAIALGLVALAIALPSWRTPGRPGRHRAPEPARQGEPLAVR
jgi:hypothetical protein